MKLLVVAAWEPELVRFRGLAAAEVEIDSLGVGPVDAAIAMTRSVMRHRPTHVVFLGTGGAARGSGLAIGDVAVGTEVRLVDPVVLEGRGAMPYATSTPLDLTLRTLFVNAGARACTIANTLAITTDDALASALAGSGQVEHLEAYAVARACEASAVACAIVLGIANEVGGSGREQWRANHVGVSARAAEIAAAAIETFRTSTTTRSPA